MKSRFFGINTKGKLLRFLAISASIGLVAATAIATPIIVLNKQKQQKEKGTSGTITAADVKQLQTDALTKISKKIY
jgi:hypothetical protein